MQSKDADRGQLRFWLGRLRLQSPTWSRWLVWILFLLCFGLSLVATVTGLRDLMMGSERDSVTLMSLVPVGLGLVILFGMAALPTQISETDRWWEKLGLLLLLLVLIFFSVTIGFSFYWNLFGGQRHASNVATIEIDRVRRPVVRYLVHLDAAEEALKRLRDHSSVKADEERTTGGCQPGVGGNEGPRFRMRQNDVTQFGAYSNDLANMKNFGGAKNLDALLKILQNEADLDHDEMTVQVNETLAEIRSIIQRQSNQITVLGDFLESRKKQLDETIKEPGTGLPFFCTDDILKTRIRVVQKHLEQMKKAGTKLPQPQDLTWYRPDRHSAWLFAVNDLLSRIPFVDYDKPSNIEQADAAGWTWLFAIVIDFVVIFLPMLLWKNPSKSKMDPAMASIDGRLSELEAVLEPGSVGQLDEGPVLTFAREHWSSSGIYNLIWKYTIQMKKRCLVIIPNEDTPQFCILVRLLDVLGYGGSFVIQKQLSPRYRRRILGFIGDSEVRIYKMSRGFLRAVAANGLRQIAPPRDGRRKRTSQNKRPIDAV